MNRRRVAVTAPADPTPPRRRPQADQVVPPESLAAARRIRRTQLRRTAVVLGASALLLFGVPVLIRLAPWLVEIRLAGVPGGWLVVAVLPYPVMAALAWAQLVAAERAERAPSPPPTGRDRA
ncbi:hypothetical protein [Pseudonocardia endophytica]|uniref:Solute:sodium symporter small subunit n=1 Tax=Pseudonocardia endophytica TaxID=401976 RepID=A0A4R1I8F4_PSEEN|nr:hypothetical protein [Pseudonocardia endophytica]TCK26442.1 hypothetical protein EV378_2279 [Pseudonocardia endophytica]